MVYYVICYNDCDERRGKEENENDKMWTILAKGGILVLVFVDFGACFCWICCIVKNEPISLQLHIDMVKNDRTRMDW